MSLHPLLTILVILDAVGLTAAAWSAVTAFRVSLGWDPRRPDAGQLLLESAAEAAALRMTAAAALAAAAGLVGLLTLTLVLPDLVPGAMCATGVLQAAGGVATAAILTRLGTGGAHWVWYALEDLNRRHPLRPLTPVTARVTLAALPIHLLAAGYAVGAIRRLAVPQAVSCCAVVYDQFRDLAAARHTAGLPHGAWLGLFLTAGLAVIVVALRNGRRSGRLAPLLAVAVGLWAPLAYVALIKVLAAYVYQVLHHHCPWCLFLPVHGMRGLLLFGLMAVAVAEGFTALAVDRAARRAPELDTAAAERQRRAARRVALAVAAFSVIAALPALMWRLRHGVWLTG